MSVNPQTWFVIGFYAIIVLLIIVFRKKFEFQAKFIALFRTKLGLKAMDKISKRFPRTVRFIGYIGIYVGYAGMAVMTYYILYSLFIFFTIPDAAATIAPVIPGVRIPGSPVFVPFLYGILAIFIVAAVHEFSHGVVARAHGIKVKNSGIVFFGPLIGAFVEPDEKQLQKKKAIVQNSMFAAGPWSNIILAAIVFVLLSFVFTPAIHSLVEEEGFYFGNVQEGLPASVAGLKNHTIYTFVNNQTVINAEEFIDAMVGIQPNDTILIGNENESIKVVAGVRDDDENKGYIGVLGIYTKNELKKDSFMFVYVVLDWFSELFVWVFILTLGIGLANLLPLGALDGGRMLRLALLKWFDRKKADKIFKIVSLCFIVFLILLFIPIIRSVGTVFVGWLV